MKTFFKNMLSNQDNISSKRLTGILCVFLACLLCVVVVLLKMEISEIHYKLIISLLVAGGSLLGVSAIEKIWKP